MNKLKIFFNIKISYAIVFISLAFWAFFAFFTMNQLIDSQKTYGKIINLSGKQRMLSQKTTLMAKRYFETYDKKILNHLKKLINTMKNDHQFLINNLTSEHMKNIYLSTPYKLDKNVIHYFQLLDEFLLIQSSELLLKLQDYSFELLPKLNYAVYEFEKESNEMVKVLQERELFILIGTLITLILEVIFIIIPTVRAITNSKEKLISFNHQLELEVQKQTKQIQLEHTQKEVYLDTINCLLVALDKDGIITMINKTGSDILGYSKENLLGKNWFELNVLVDNEINHVKAFFSDIITQKIDISDKVFENELIDKNGNKKTFTWSNSLIKDGKEVIGVLSSAIDITVQKEQAKIISEQTKLASMGEMIGNIAHQWRQPLSIISTVATGSIMQKEVGVLSDEKLIRDLNLINENSQYLSKTIDTFRNFLLEEKEYKEVILQDRIGSALEILESTLKNNYIEVINNIKKQEPVKMSLITGELSQVVINIINNAKDILQENKIQKPWIKLDLEKKDKSVIISIEDNGGGIPDNVLPRIFEPYFTTKHKSQGTGLGLHMSYKIVNESLHGKIYAKNSNNGAKFFIELPLNN